MTEEQWRACTSPEALLNALTDRASPRKLRLYAIGCCRRIWSLLNKDDRSRYAVDVAQEFADGLAGHEQLAAAEKTVAMAAHLWGEVGSPLARATFAIHGAAWAATRVNAWHAAWDAAWDARMAARDFIQADWERERHWQADLLHDLFGNPHQPCTVDPYWLAFDGGAVNKLATVIYREDRFGDLPILADALEEAGCDRVDVLDHCRSRTPHYRGCWVVDLLLGYQ